MDKWIDFYEPFFERRDAARKFHEGHYWSFHFNDVTTPMLNTEPDVIANMQLIELRALVVSGCINAVCTYAGRPN